jgi:hypothetical protein
MSTYFFIAANGTLQLPQVGETLTFADKIRGGKETGNMQVTNK